MGSRPEDPDAHRPFTSRPIVPLYSLNFLYTALIQAWTGLGLSFPNNLWVQLP